MSKRIVTRSARYTPPKTRAIGNLNGMGFGNSGAPWDTRYHQTQGHQQEQLLAAITNAVAADVANVSYFKMKARKLGTGTEIENDPITYAFNIGASMQVSATLLRSYISTQLDYQGEAYIVEMPGPGGSATLTPIIGGQVTVAYAAPGQTLPDGSAALISGYHIRDAMGKVLGSYDADGNAMTGMAEGKLHRIHVPFPGDPFRANSFVGQAGLAVDVVHASTLATRSLLMNAGRPSALVQIMDDSVTEDSIREFDQRLNSRLNDPTQNGKIFTVGSDVKYTELGGKGPDQSWVEMSNLSRQDVMAIWQMPVSRLGIGGAKTYENQRTELAQYYASTIMGRLNLICSALNQSLRRRGYEVYIEKADIPALSEDIEVRLARAQALWTVGLATRNEAREIAGLPPVDEEGDKFSTDPSNIPVPAPNFTPPERGIEVGDALPFVRAADGPQLEDKLDKSNDEHIEQMELMAQAYNLRVFRRVAGALRRQSDAGPIDVATVFDQSKFDKELRQDLAPNLHQVATGTALVIGKHLQDKRATHLDTTALVAAHADLMVNGNQHVDGWNAGIARDLNAKFSDPANQQNTTADNIAIAASILGIQVDANGDPLPTQDTGGRASTMSLRAVLGLSAAVAVSAYGAVGVQQQQWVSMRDSKVRDTHAEADGQIVDVGSPFSVGGYDLMYPCDPDGPPEETANCRCVAVPAT